MTVSPLPFSRWLISLILSIAFISAIVHAQPPDPGYKYQPEFSAVNIAPTVATASVDKVAVFGQPRMTEGHPCTLWDQQDIEELKKILKTSKELRIQLAELKERMDARMAKTGLQPEDIPTPRKGGDGKWLFPGEYYPPVPDFPNDDAATRFRHRFCPDTEVISDLGTLYVLTGEAKYGEYARKLLLAYANFTRFGTHSTFNPTSNIGITTDAFLEEGLKMVRLARGYDLVYNLPSWTPDEHKRMHNDLFQPWASSLIYPRVPQSDPYDSHSAQPNNRGVFSSAGVLMAGYVTGDEELVNAALYGITATISKTEPLHIKQWPLPKDWVASTKEKPTKGLTTVHFAEPCLGGGMWVEGSVSYTLYAMCCMINAAETAWHHGIDLYRHNNGIFKTMFDYPIIFGYPDMTAPSLNDAARFNLAAGMFKGGYCGQTLYEYGYRRYRDPRYLWMINTARERAYLASLDDPETEKIPLWKRVQSLRSLSVATVGSQPPSFMYDIDPNEGVKGPPLMQPSVNYSTVGFGVLRVPDGAGNGVNNLILSYGPTIPHGHPDKLHVDLFAFGDVLVPSPGVIFPYQLPLVSKWYHTTLSHNTLTVDEKLQYYEADLFKLPKDIPHPRADQLVYGPASTMGIQRVWTNTVYSGVTMDRAVYLTQEYMADIFGAFSSERHKYDLAWHIRGELSTDLKFEPMQFPDPVADGYNILTNVRKATTSKTWSAEFMRNQHKARLMSAGAFSTQVIVGDDGPFSDWTLFNNNKQPTAPTVLERRENTAATIYGNALDISDTKDGFIKSLTQIGGAELGYGLLLVDTMKGRDYCFVSYFPGDYKNGDFETDAQQAFARCDGQKAQSMYLGGGKLLKTGGGTIERSEPGLAFIEKTKTGYIAGNSSPTDATIKITLPGLAELEAYNLDANGQRIGKTEAKKQGNTVFLRLKAASSVEFQ